MRKSVVFIFGIFLLLILSSCQKKCEHQNIIIDKGYAATCTDSGLSDGSHCKDCGEILEAQVVIDALGHKEKEAFGIAPSCTEPGLTPEVYCKVCNKILMSQEVIEPLGHKAVIDEGVKESCTNHGLTNGSHCEVCGKVLEAQEVIEPHGHHYVEDLAVAPTCTQPGLTSGIHCDECNEVFIAQEEIAPLGHKIVEDPQVEPTIYECGLTEGSHCEVCGEVIVKQEVIDKIISYNVTALPNNSYYGHIEGNTNQILLENEESEEITAIPNLGYRFVSWSNGEKDETIRITPTEDTVLVANFEIDAYELPIMEIYTQDNAPIISKDDYVNCNVSVSNALYKYCFDSLSGKIKGRGNSTWNMAKKPYKLKFDKKIDLFGNGKAKTWTLIANYCDKSMIRNYIAYSMGELLESDYVTSTQFIELFLNGEYLGVYLVCEQNEVGENRVEIDESYTDVNTGYLLELDRRAPDEGIEEGKDWFKLNTYYAIKSPEPDDPLYTVEFTNYIMEYLNASYNSILSKNYEDVKNYIDVDSFAKTYIVHEIMNMMDVAYSSFYIYKDKDGKLKSGPLWDFDISSGNYNYNFTDPATSYSVIWAKINPWYYKLLEIEEFRNLLCDYLKDNYIKICKLLNNILKETDDFKNSFERNFIKWDILEKYVWPNPTELVEIHTWMGQVEWLMDWLHKSLDYVYNYYVNASNDAYSIGISSGDTYKVQVFNSLDILNPTIVLNNAWSRDLSTGSLVKDGSGAIILKINIVDGYKLKSVGVNDDTLITSIECLDREKNIYRINGIQGDIEVAIETEENASIPIVSGYNIVFTHNEHVSIMIYPDKVYTVDGEIKDSFILDDTSGDGQVNFKVIIDDGYHLDSINITGSYKNIKDPSDTGADFVYRITKVSGDLTINISVIEE